jgi:hypothetical protein
MSFPPPVTPVPSPPPDLANDDSANDDSLSDGREIYEDDQNEKRYCEENGIYVDRGQDDYEEENGEEDGEEDGENEDRCDGETCEQCKIEKLRSE